MPVVNITTFVVNGAGVTTSPSPGVGGDVVDGDTRAWLVTYGGPFNIGEQLTDFTANMQSSVTDGGGAPDAAIRAWNGLIEFNVSAADFPPGLIPDGAIITRLRWIFDINWTGGVVVNATIASQVTLFVSGGLGITNNPLIINTISGSSQSIADTGVDGVSFDRVGFLASSFNDINSITKIVGASRTGANPSFTLGIDTAITLEITYREIEETGSGGVVIGDGAGLDPLYYTGEGGLLVYGDPLLVLSVDVSGIYTLVPNQRYDDLYTRDNDDRTVAVPIPTPFFKTGYVGG